MEFPEMTMILLAAVISLIAYLVMMAFTRHRYWKDRRIPYMKPLPIFGNMLRVIGMKQSMGELYREAYLKFPNERLVGIYETVNPVLVLRDPGLIEKFLVKDFQHFIDRTKFSEDEGLFDYGLFQMKTPAWRSVRYKISPAFTSGKLKGMFNGMVDCTEEMMTRFDENLNKDYEARDALSLFTINVIANSVFGIQIGNKNAMDDFLRMSNTIFDTSPGRFIHSLAITQIPKVANFLGMKYMSSEVTNYFRGFIKNALKQREYDKYQRNDYTQQLLKLKEKGAIEVQSKDADDEYLDLDNTAPTENLEISNDLLAGQAFQFLSAGYDPVVATMVYIMYDMARFPEVQERARNHVQEVLAKHNGYSYACLQDMPYLDQCLQETMRLHPIAPALFRECTKNYHIPEEGLEVEKGQKVIIPILALHMDPKYYPDPEIYNPDRFPPNVTRQNFTYLPFGDGPRLCIGLRYAMIVMKLGMAKILSKYKFTLSSRTQVPLLINKQSILILPKHKVLFNVNKI